VRGHAAVGAAVNSLQEAQALIQPVILPQILAIMFLRIVVLTPPWWQIAFSIGLCLATIAALTWVVARIYRVGILHVWQEAHVARDPALGAHGLSRADPTPERTRLCLLVSNRAPAEPHSGQ
jgi:ABC-type Na+ efflux pump permease subunit